jgi:hypothetical protein
MTSVLNTKSTNIATLDTLNPFQALTAGEGAPARLWEVEDQVTLPVTFFSATNNYARLCRFPTMAKIKDVSLFTDVAVDSAASTGAAAFTVGVAFSDSTIDGTPPAYQGLVPSTVGIGGGTTTAGTVVALPSTSGANVLFGTVTAPATTAAIPLTNVTFNGTEATYFATGPLSLAETPLLKLFNLWDITSKPLTNLGFFDLVVLTSHAYTTVPNAAANLYARVRYAI